MAAVMIGVDPHKASHTAVVISAAEEPLGELRVRACVAQAERLLAWAAAWPQRIWAVEGAGDLRGRLRRRPRPHPRMVVVAMPDERPLAGRARLRLARGVPRGRRAAIPAVRLHEPACCGRPFCRDRGAISRNPARSWSSKIPGSRPATSEAGARLEPKMRLSRGPVLCQPASALLVMCARLAGR
jgi:hypothetical protein